MGRPGCYGFSDGVIAGATLDRNGLRPLRYAITSDGLFIAGSEAGTVEVDQTSIVEKGRLGPGQMVVVDTARRMVLRNLEIKTEVATLQPWEDWLVENRVKLSDDADSIATPPSTISSPCSAPTAIPARTDA